MTSWTSGHHRLGAVAGLFLALVLGVLVAQAFAAGEDDPGFGAEGTTFLPLTGATYETDPVVDEAPDGSVWTALGIQRSQTSTGTTASTAPPATVTDERTASRGDQASTALRISRLDAGGVPAGLDGDGTVDVPLALLSDLFDIESGPSGAIVAGVALVPVIDDDDRRVPASRPALFVATVSASGALTDLRTFFAPGACESAYGRPAAAEISASGVVYAVWNECSGPPVFSEHRGAQTSATTISQASGDAYALEVALGPGDVVHALLSETPGDKGRGPGGVHARVVRFSAQGASELPYQAPGVEDPGTVGGMPLDLTVDGEGRAVVWTAAPFLRAGGTWTLHRLGTGGAPDPTFSGDGTANVTHPDLPNVCGDECGEDTHLIAQADAKVIAIARVSNAYRAAGTAEHGAVIARLTAAGDLDAIGPDAWDGDGVKIHSPDQPEQGVARFVTVGEPGLQADGKLLVPLLAIRTSGVASRAPTPPIGAAAGVSRIGLTPEEEEQQQNQQQGGGGSTTTSTTPVAASQPSVQAPRQCRSRRRFTIRLRTGRRKAERSPIVSAQVTVNGKRVRVTRRARRTARVVLTTLPKGRFSVQIRLRLADGGIVRETRRYRTCAPKIERELPPLRTRPPGKG